MANPIIFYYKLDCNLLRLIQLLSVKKNLKITKYYNGPRPTKKQ